MKRISSRHSLLVLLVAFGAGTLVANGLTPVLATSNDEVLTFAVSVTDESGATVTGNALATLVPPTADQSPDVKVYRLARSMTGTSSKYATGTATTTGSGDSMSISVQFDRSPGILAPGTAIVVLAVYAALTLGAAAVRVAHRDA